MSILGELISNAGGITGAFNKHSPIGAAVQGVIVSADVMQVNNYDTGKPEFWDDGSPQQQVRIVVDTQQIDPSIENDNGHRAIYIKWWGDQRKAFIDAIKAANDTDAHVGGMFRAQYTGTKPNEKNPRLNDLKLYSFAYQAPVGGTGLDMGAPAQQAAPQQQYQAPAPVQQQYQAPAPAQQQYQQAAPAQQYQQPAPVQQQYQDPWSGGQTDAAQQALQQQLGAQPVQQQYQAPAPVQQQAAPAQQAPAGEDPEAKVRQLLALSFPDDQITAATGVPLERVAQIRAGA